MIRRAVLAVACAASALTLAPPADAVEVTGCSYTRQSKSAPNYEEGSLKAGPVVRPPSTQLYVQCTVRYDTADGPIMGRISGSTAFFVPVIPNSVGVTATTPVGFIVMNVFLNYGSAPPVGTLLYGCLTSWDAGTGHRVEHGCNVMHTYT